MKAFVEQAPAKINLTLSVLGRRNDGYHQLHSLVAFARDIFDVVELRLGPDTTIDVHGPNASQIVGANILERAIAAVRRPHLRLGKVLLVKNLPVASGIGGGSADAAALLRAVRSANDHVDEGNLWHEVATGLGADVPVCLANVPAMMFGTGAELDPLQAFPTLHAVLANPLARVPADKTAQVFRALGLAPVGTTPFMMSGPRPPNFKCADEVIAYVMASANQLVAPACSVVPEIAEVLRALEGLTGSRVVRMSGAGPTCFAIFDTADVALDAAGTLQRNYPSWWIKPTRLC